jgi:hypothetical protein
MSIPTPLQAEREEKRAAVRAALLAGGHPLAVAVACGVSMSSVARERRKLAVEHSTKRAGGKRAPVVP